MRRLLLATAALLATISVASADIISNLGINPDSGAGAFANTNPGTGAGGSGLFIDTYNFTLVGDQVLTIAFATNTYAGGATQQITSFQGAVVWLGEDGVIGGIGADADQVVLGPELGSPCAAIPLCQVFGGSAVLPGGNYFLAVSGNAGVNAGYGGNLSTFAVPGPIVGAGLPGLLASFAMFGAWYRRRKAAA